MKKLVLIFLLLSGTAKAGILDLKVSTAQIFDVQWNASSNLNTSGFSYIYASVRYSDQALVATRLTAANYADINSVPGRYIGFFLNTTTHPGTYGMAVFNSDGTQYKVLNYTGTFRAIADGAIFYNGNGSWGTLITTGAGYSLGGSATFPITINNPSTAQLQAYTPPSLVPLAAGQVASAVTNITSGITATLAQIPGSYNPALDGGTLSLSNGDSSSTALTISGNNGTAAIASGSATLSGVISGVGKLTKSGAGTLVLSGTNTYQGGTEVAAGILSVGADANLGNASGAITLSGGTLAATDTFSTARNISITSASAIDVASGKTLTNTGIVSGSLGLTKSGAGTLNLNGVNTYTGTLTVSAGTLNVGSTSSSTNSQLLSNISISSGATLSGYGILGATGKTVTNSGTVNNGADLGAITVNGNYTQTSNGTLLIKLTPNNTDVLNVAGVATLDGGLRISPAAGSYTTARYTILTANSIGGAFSSLTNLRPSLNFSVGYDATSVYLDYVSNSGLVASLASGPYKRIANQVITGLGDSSTLIQQLSSSTTAIVDKTMRQMAAPTVNIGVGLGKTASAATSIVFDKAGTFTGDFSSSRDLQSKIFESSMMPNILPTSNMSFQQLATNFAVNPINYRKSLQLNRNFIGEDVSYDKFNPGKFGGWIQGYVDRGFGDATPGSAGFRNETFGVIGATEYSFSEDVLAGVFVSQSKSTSVVDESSGNMDIDQTQVGFYAQKILDGYKLSGSASVGKQKYKNKRNISVAGVSALSNYDGHSHQGSLGVSRLSKLGHASIEPFGLLSYSKTSTDGYSEVGAISGSDNYNLTVDKTKSSIGSVTSGITFTLPFRIDKNDVRWKLRPAVRYSDELVKPVVSTAFVGSSASTQYDSRRVDKWVRVMTTELNLSLSKESSLKLGGEYQEGKTYDSYRLFGQYDWKF